MTNVLSYHFDDVINTGFASIVHASCTSELVMKLFQPGVCFQLDFDK